MAKKKTKKTLKTEELAVTGDLQVVAGRYANHVQVIPNEEEFVLDFFARAGQPALVHVGRIFIAPNHARRLMDLLKRQIIRHKRTYPNSPLKQTAPKRKGKA